VPLALLLPITNIMSTSSIIDKNGPVHAEWNRAQGKKLMLSRFHGKLDLAAM